MSARRIRSVSEYPIFSILYRHAEKHISPETKTAVLPNNPPLAQDGATPCKQYCCILIRARKTQLICCIPRRVLSRYDATTQGLRDLRPTVMAGSSDIMATLFPADAASAAPHSRSSPVKHCGHDLPAHQGKTKMQALVGKNAKTQAGVSPPLPTPKCNLFSSTGKNSSTSLNLRGKISCAQGRGCRTRSTL